MLLALLRAKNSSLSCLACSRCLLFLFEKESLGPAIAGGLLVVGAPSTWSGSTFGEASDSACLDAFLSLLIVTFNYVILRTLVLLSYS
jgi:hypothetical protein